jgi:hypothetical protein
MPVKKNLKKALLGSMDEPDKMFQTWANNMQWHHFLDKKPSLYVEPEKHTIGIYSESFWLRDGKWGSVGIHIWYNWLKDEYELWTYPEVVLDGEPTMLGDPVNPWELPGQRFLENFHFNGGQKDAGS